MSSDLQTVLPFDTEGDSLPDVLKSSVDAGADQDAGMVVTLLADPATRESGWAPRAALALARGWSEEGRRVFLMDGNLAEPVLHSLLDEPNEEGVADAVLYGVSPSRMARTRDEGFLFASAGTAVADPASVFRHPRWRSVLSACRESGALVVLYLPAGTPAADTLAGEGDRVLRLRSALSAGAGGTPTDHVVLHPPRSGAAAGTPAGAPQAEGAAESGAAEAPAGEGAVRPASAPGESGDDELVGHGTPTLAASTPASAGRGAPPAMERPDTDEGPDGSAAVPEPARTSGSSGRLEPRPIRRRMSALGVVLLLLLVLLVGGVVVAALLGLLDIPGLTPSPDAALGAGRSFQGS